MKHRIRRHLATDPRFRIPPDNFFSVRQAIAVQKGGAARLALVNAFLDEARASGLIQGAIARAPARRRRGAEDGVTGGQANERRLQSASPAKGEESKREAKEAPTAPESA